MSNGKKRRETVWRAAEMAVQRLEARRLLSATLEDGSWEIETDDDLAHTITIDTVPNKPSRLRALIDGEVVGTVNKADVDWVDIYGGDGDDKIVIDAALGDIYLCVYAEGGNDTIIGGPGDDDLSGEDGNDSIIGGGGNDTLYGDDGQDTIDGGKGDDEIYSEAGDDSVSGGGGSDTIYAGSGDDDVDGDEGDDQLWGGWGDDDLDGDEGDDDLGGGSGDDDLDGGYGDDEMGGGTGADELDGGDGDDEIFGKAGRDTLDGGVGDDLMSGGRGNDEEHGGIGDDRILGQRGSDTIWGEAGIDTINGGAQIDTIHGEVVDQIKWGRWDVSRNEELLNPLSKLKDTAALKDWLIDEAVKDYRYQLGTQSTRYWYDGWYGRYPRYWRDIDCCFYSIHLATGFTQGAVATLDHSNTNTQEQAVDEADLVETDGEYLYTITDGKLTIVSALPAENTAVVSRTAIDGQVQGMYLDGNRLVVLSQVYKSVPVGNSDDAYEISWFGYRSYEQVKVTVYDIDDRANPTVAEETSLDGYLTSSRMIDGRLYVVMNNWFNTPQPRRFDVGEAVETGETISEPLWWGRVTIYNDALVAAPPEGNPEAQPQPVYKQWKQDYRYETEAEYRARLEAMPLEQLLPGYSASFRGADDQTIETSGGLAGSIYTPDDTSHFTHRMSSVVLINLDDPQPGPTARTNIIGMDGQIYASAENLYVTTQVTEEKAGSQERESRTDIYKFGLDEDSVELKATGEVPGRIINSFSMDEEGEYFRIATTSSWSSSNNIYVLKEKGHKLDIVGGITGLAAGERIFAARFVGERAYLVTFRQTDPLFTIDLSEPQSPRVVAELKIPGFSTYLHPIDDDHLLAIGRDGGDLQVSLFDVSDMARPRRIDVFTITGGWGNFSAAESDHHAFAYFAEHHVLVLPFGNYDDGHAGSILLNVDLENGIGELGRVDLASTYYLEQRNVRIGEYLYALAGSRLKVVSLTDPSQVVADVNLKPAEDTINA